MRSKGHRTRHDQGGKPGRAGYKLSVRRRQRHDHAYRLQQIPIDQQDAKWKCETCESPTENPDSRWCIHCRLYWEDCRA